MNQNKKACLAGAAIILFMAPFFIQLVHNELHRHHEQSSETGFENRESDCLINSYEFQPHFLFEHQPKLQATPFLIVEVKTHYAFHDLPLHYFDIRLRAPPQAHIA